ncbi:MAG: nucleotidyltransferase domain-containing protein [Nitrospira sp.]|nr:nucleotidyltransferase domain-containing protein [Nitrospira sp.]
MTTSWVVTPKKVEAVIRRILEVSQPRKLILFGSYVRGNMNVNSDLDILMVTGDEVKNTRKESVRIRRALRGISMPMDILVIQESRLKELAELPGLIYREALKHGEVVYESIKQETTARIS